MNPLSRKLCFKNLSHPLFVAIALMAALLLAAWLLPLAGLVPVIGLLVAMQLGLTIADRRRPVTFTGASLLDLPFRLASDSAIFERYQALLSSLLQISQHADPIYRDIALEQLDQLARETKAGADGKFVFEGTETWRIVYERLLRSPGLYRYRSVAWIKNANYWQDEPGRKSMSVNFELHSSGQLTIARIAIIADELWPQGDVWPTEILRQWVHEQHARGLSIKVIRESVLKNEPKLLADIGIYGNRALGLQELDDQCRTVRFTLTFDYAQVQAAEERWRRLEIYAESWSRYLDRYEIAD